MSGSKETAPSGEPAPQPTQEPPAFGWNAYAERLNGRFAMIGFIALLLLELGTRQDFFTWLGLPR
ncbi:MAG: chlorophyll a/b-binding protein [Cyanobacteria bacterium P01_A01_bin.114]